MTHRKNRDLEAENARLAEALAAANTECDSRAVAMRELRAEVERLRSLLSNANTQAQLSTRDAKHAESRLAAANTLLKHSRDWDGPYKNDDAFYEARDAYLDAQPATAPARTVAYGSSPVGGANLSPEYRPSIAEMLAPDEAERTCRGCREGSEHHHTCQRAVIPPQTYVPPSVLRAQLEAEKVHAAGVVAMNATCIRDRDRARTALEAIRPVAAALETWGLSWIDANSSPDPDDLPEEAALFEAWKAVARRMDVRELEPYVPCASCGTLTNADTPPLCLCCSNLGGP